LDQRSLPCRVFDDELFTNCSPHDFYILIPTLLRQSIMAYQQGKLTQESLKVGLDCRCTFLAWDWTCIH